MRLPKLSVSLIARLLVESRLGKTHSACRLPRLSPPKHAAFLAALQTVRYLSDPIIKLHFAQRTSQPMGTTNCCYEFDKVAAIPDSASASLMAGSPAASASGSSSAQSPAQEDHRPFSHPQNSVLQNYRPIWTPEPWVADILSNTIRRIPREEERFSREFSYIGSRDESSDGSSDN